MCVMRRGILSGVFGQSAFNAGPLSLSLPVIDTVEPVSSVILGAAVFQEHLAHSAGLLALQLVGGAIAAAGIVVLSHSPVVLAEESRESQSAGPQASQASAKSKGLKEVGSRRQASPLRSESHRYRMRLCAAVWPRHRTGRVADLLEHLAGVISLAVMSAASSPWPTEHLT